MENSGTGSPGYPAGLSARPLSGVSGTGLCDGTSDSEGHQAYLRISGGPLGRGVSPSLWDIGKDVASSARSPHPGWALVEIAVGTTRKVESACEAGPPCPGFNVRLSVDDGRDSLDTEVTAAQNGANGIRGNAGTLRAERA